MDHKELDDFIASLGLGYKTVFVPQSQSRNAKEKQPSLNWSVKITHGRQELQTDYMQGCAHIPHYAHAFSHLVVYDNAVREACETGKSRIISHKNGYDAAQGDQAFARFTQIPEPALRDVLYSLMMDASAIDYATFEEWAGEYGYDTDSRKAESIYRDCLEISLKLRAMLGDEKLAKLHEMFQDY